jgi:hypothetical protein
VSGALLSISVSVQYFGSDGWVCHEKPHRKSSS